jgi:hypothetical protein
VTFVSPRHWIAGWRLPDPDDAGTDLDARSLPEPTSRRNADVEPTPLVRVVEIDVDVEATQPLGRGAGCVIDEPLHGDARFRALPERRERLLG